MVARQTAPGYTRCVRTEKGSAQTKRARAEAPRTGVYVISAWNVQGTGRTGCHRAQGSFFADVQVLRKNQWSKEKTATNKKEVVYTDWDKAHHSISKDVIDRRRNNKRCTQCGITNHFWKHCRKVQSVTTFGTRQYESNKQKRDQPQAPRKRVAVVAKRGQGQSSRSVNRIDRPAAWEMYHGETL